MIYHYFDPWRGVEIWNHPATSTNTPLWKSTSGLKSLQSPAIDVVKSDKFTTLVVRDDEGSAVLVIDLTAEEVAELTEKFK